MELNAMISVFIGSDVPDLFEDLEKLGTNDGDILTVAGYKFYRQGDKLEAVTDPNGNRLEPDNSPVDEYDWLDYEYAICVELGEMTRLSETEIEEWLERMQYTVKTGADGTPYIFLAILCGKGKLNSVQMTQIAEYAYERSYPNGRFSMEMWIGGSVDWTMLYNQPFRHVNGRETFFCGGVGKDNYSPDDWEADMKLLGKDATQRSYIEFLFNGRKVAA